MDNKYLFQYCQKLVIFNEDFDKILLAKRKWENDYDWIFSFVWWKMEITDKNIVDWISREKSEEIWVQCKIKVFKNFSSNLEFLKKDWSHMILPHYLCVFLWGNIILNEEYSEYKWISINEINSFEPKIETIKEIIEIFHKNIPYILNTDYFIC